ncbi:MAG TPA: aspartyl/asparaginyl beta-hydroxylase domain-containing protein [Planctomycetes bacterium]|nr:aspartyl/asparaginyl beta-hydroxylase domain-containing protein [Planctomycetota bacterium]
MGIRSRLAERLQKVLNRLIAAHVGGDDRPVFYDAAKVRPELLELDANLDVVREELARVLPGTQKMPRYHEADAAQTEISAKGRGNWRVFFISFFWAREDFPSRAWCPRTAEIVDRIPGFLQAFFSIMEGGKSVPAHVGPGLHYLRYHIGLQIPEKNPPSIRIRDEVYTWKDGESMFFDDSLEHEVMNEAEEDRIILIVDVLRPLPWHLHLLNKLLLLLRTPRRKHLPEMNASVAIEIPAPPATV